jgi:hypothetical protein
MKTPSGTFIVIILAVIAIGSILIFQACATTANGGGGRADKRFTLHIGKDQNSFVEFKKGGKPDFDSVLRTVGTSNYHIRYLPNPTATPDNDYHPPKIAVKTDKITTSELAKNEPPGDPHITQKVASDTIADIKKVLDALQ